MTSGPIEPVLDFVLRLGDSGSNSALSGGKIGVGGCSGDIALAFESLAKLLLSLSNVLADDVAARVFILAEIAERDFGDADMAAGRGIWRLGRVGCGRVLAGEQAADGCCDQGGSDSRSGKSHCMHAAPSEG